MSNFKDPVGKQVCMFIRATAIASLLTMTLVPVYGDAIKEERIGMEDLYNGIKTAGPGGYKTENYYLIQDKREWMKQLSINYFHSQFPDNILFYFDKDSPEYCKVGTTALENMEVFLKKEEEYEAKINELVLMTEGKSKEEKIRFFHDYLINVCTYDMTLSQSNAYDCLIGGISTCNGYSIAFYNLCTAAGIETQYITGGTDTNSDPSAHSWNRVKLDDGNWYYIDVTWDDCVSGDKYFMIPEEVMNQDHIPDIYVA